MVIAHNTVFMNETNSIQKEAVLAGDLEGFLKDIVKALEIPDKKRRVSTITSRSEKGIARFSPVERRGRRYITGLYHTGGSLEASVMARFMGISNKQSVRPSRLQSIG